MTAVERPYRRARDTERSARSADGQVVGVMLVIGGVAWLLQRSGAFDISWESLLSVLLVVLGLGLVATARRRGGAGLIVLGIGMTVVLASTSSIDIGTLKAGVGDRVTHPVTLAEARSDTRLAAGNLWQDLRDVDFPEGRTDLSYRVAFGDLRVTVPEGVPVKVIATTRAGEIRIFGDVRSGTGLDRTVTEPGWSEAPKRLVIRANAGFGSVRVDRNPLRVLGSDR